MGFTLIELMIVIVILGILAGIVLFAVGGITDRGTTAACKTDLSTIQTGVEAYYAKKGITRRTSCRTLTDPAGNDQFLKWDAGFTGSTDATGPTSDVHTGTGYSVTYYPTTVVATPLVMSLPTSASRQRSQKNPAADRGRVLSCARCHAEAWRPGAIGFATSFGYRLRPSASS